jgi:Fic/DOC family
MLTGYTAVVDELKLSVPTPYTESRIVGAVRRSEVHADRALEVYPKKHSHSGDLRGHLLFALKHEPTDLGVLCAAFKKIGPELVRKWVLDEPTGAYSRRAWFLYEFLVGQELDLPKARTGNYTDVLNPKQHIVGDRFTSTRHRVWDNLLGVPGFCPTVRRTQKLLTHMAQSLDKEVSAMMDAVDPDLLRRAVSYLYTKETRSSFEIEGETVNPKREQRFVAALAHAAKFDPTDKAQLISLQNAIVEPRYAATGWRTIQNYVGETASGYREVVLLVCPKPEDVDGLMKAWAQMCDRLLSEPIDPIIAAALASFSFVFVHPFEDGNGRIHRFLVHNVLARKQFSPEGVIFPVSVAIVRDRPAYDTALEMFSKPLLSLIDWRLTGEQTLEQKLVVQGDTADLYRYYDATPQVEYLYDRVAETIRKDLAEELEFIGAYDRAYNAVRDVVDMPNRKITLFVRLCMQNNGRFPKSRRKQFSELTDAEIAAMETAVRVAQRSHEQEKLDAVDD